MGSSPAAYSRAGPGSAHPALAAVPKRKVLRLISEEVLLPRLHGVIKLVTGGLAHLEFELCLCFFMLI